MANMQTARIIGNDLARLRLNMRYDLSGQSALLLLKQLISNIYNQLHDNNPNNDCIEGMEPV